VEVIPGGDEIQKTATTVVKWVEFIHKDKKPLASFRLQ
jgi:hypothetical protein